MSNDYFQTMAEETLTESGVALSEANKKKLTNEIFLSLKEVGRNHRHRAAEITSSSVESGKIMNLRIDGSVNTPSSLITVTDDSLIRDGSGDAMEASIAFGRSSDGTGITHKFSTGNGEYFNSEDLRVLAEEIDTLNNEANK